MRSASPSAPVVVSAKQVQQVKQSILVVHHHVTAPRVVPIGRVELDAIRTAMFDFRTLPFATEDENLKSWSKSVFTTVAVLGIQGADGIVSINNHSIDSEQEVDLVVQHPDLALRPIVLKRIQATLMLNDFHLGRGSYVSQIVPARQDSSHHVRSTSTAAFDDSSLKVFDLRPPAPATSPFFTRKLIANPSHNGALSRRVSTGSPE